MQRYLRCMRFFPLKFSLLIPLHRGSWSLITATVNRVILIGTDIVWEASQQASVYQLDFIETPFAAVNPFKSITSSNEIPLAAGNGVVISSLTVEHVD